MGFGGVGKKGSKGSEVYMLLSASCRVAQCPDLDSIPHEDKRSLEVAVNDLDARRVVDVLEKHTCRLCTKADHK